MEKQLDFSKLPKMPAERIDLGWIIVDAYLDGLELVTSELSADPEYKKRFDALRSYTDLMINGSEDRIMIDTAATVYREKKTGY